MFAPFASFGSGSGGATTFVGLADVLEADYAGHAGQVVIVNPGETGLVFGTAAGGIQSSIFDTDLNTGIEGERTPDVNNLNFQTAGVDRAIITSTGEFGYGTNSPETLFHIQVSDSGTIPHSMADVFIDSNSETILHLGSPNAGIGSAVMFGSPMSSLGGFVNWRAIQAELSIGTFLANGRIDFFTDIYERQVSIRGSGQMAWFKYQSENSFPVAAVGSLVFDADGYIGTAGLSDSSQIQDADSNTGIEAERTADANRLNFRTVGNDAMIINENQHVGIGTNTPNSIFHIETNGGTGATPSVAADEAFLNGVADTGLTIVSGNANNAQIFLGGGTTNFRASMRYFNGTNELRLGTNLANGVTTLASGGGAVRLTVSANGDLNFNAYPNTRDDSGSSTIQNVLYTDGANNLLSHPEAPMFPALAQEITAQKNFDEVALTDAATTNWDVNTHQVCRWTLGGNNTLAAPTNMNQGGFYTIRIVPSGNTPTFDAIYDFGAIVPDWSHQRILTYYFDGTNMLLTNYR